MKLIINKKYSILSFIIGFSLMAYMLYNKQDMITGLGDTQDIWKTITSFRTNDIYPSYVLYKGFLSVYPYVWFYDLANLLKIDCWIIFKLYHCVLFAYAAGIGMPAIIKKTFKIEFPGYRQLLLPIALYLSFGHTLALQFITIDLPSWAFFVLSVNAALKIPTENFKRNILLYIYSGLCSSLCFCFSGQYSISAILVILFVIIRTIPKKVLIDKTKRFASIGMVIIMLFGVLSIKQCDGYFEKNVVDVMRNNGHQIASSSVWLNIGLSRFISKYEWSIVSNRGISIINDREKNEEEAQKYVTGEKIYSKSQLVKMILKNPVDFMTKWINTFFISISFDGAKNSVSHLFLSYSSLFICLYLIFMRAKKIRNILCPETLIALAFILSIAAVIVLQSESRYSLSIMSLIISVGVLSDVFYKCLSNIKNFIFSRFQKEKIKIADMKIPYAFIIYVLFIIICFTHFGTIKEITGTDPKILFSW